MGAAEQVGQTQARAEYVPGIGWMYITAAGRFGSFDTEQEAIAAAISAATGAA
jgi:hypothetical protein